MENQKVAAFFIGTLLEQVIENVELNPQEFTYTNQLAGLSVFRVDFIATIRTSTGELKKVLIEIQKAKNQIDIMRFRNYLAEQYKKEDEIEGEKVILPITTIYILGFKLPEITSACIKVERNYKDLITKSYIEQKSDFIEKLTHDCYIVQVERITDRFQTRLDKLLSIFEQKHFIDDKEITKDYQHTPDIEELIAITDILHFVGTEPQERLKIEVEQEAWRTVNAMFEEKERNHKKAIQEKDQALQEKEQALSEKDKLIEELLKKLGDKK